MCGNRAAALSAAEQSRTGAGGGRALGEPFQHQQRDHPCSIRSPLKKIKIEIICITGSNRAWE